MRGNVDFEELMREPAADYLAGFDRDASSSLEKLEQILAEPAAPAPRDSRRAVVGRSHVVLAVFAVLVAAGGAAAAVALTSGQSPPVPLPGGGRVLCPMDSPYLADGSQGLEYPPNYPGSLPLGTRGMRCYATEADALHAGFKPAPPPAGDARLGDLYLTPPPEAVRNACRAAARLIRGTVYCPSLVPEQLENPTAMGLPVADNRHDITADCPSSGCSIPLLSIWGNFIAPDTRVWSEQYGGGSLTVWEMTKAQQRTYPYLAGALYSNGRVAVPQMLRRTSFHGVPATWYSVYTIGGPSTELEWQVGHETYGITASGPPTLSRRLVQFIADHLRQEPPTH